jgi:hypothetical protein
VVQNHAEGLSDGLSVHSSARESAWNTLPHLCLLRNCAQCPRLQFVVPFPLEAEEFPQVGELDVLLDIVAVQAEVLSLDSHQLLLHVSHTLVEVGVESAGRISCEKVDCKQSNALHELAVAMNDLLVLVNVLAFDCGRHQGSAAQGLAGERDGQASKLSSRALPPVPANDKRPRVDMADSLALLPAALG